VYGSPVLRADNKEIDAAFSGLEKFVEDMFDTMYAAEGVGLAAPQVGRNVRAFVVDVTAWADEEPELADFRRAFINPEIYECAEEESLYNEGCLSLPGLHEDVSRPVSIRMRYLDEHLQPHDEEFTGRPARVIQHEYDHLEGKVFTDRLSPLRRTLLKSKLTGFTKGKFKASYRTK
jgi:peptide deformylase